MSHIPTNLVIRLPWEWDFRCKSFSWLLQAGCSSPSVWPSEETVAVWDKNDVATAAEITSGQPRAVWLHCCPCPQTPVPCSSCAMGCHRARGHAAHPSVWPSFQPAPCFCLNCATSAIKVLFSAISLRPMGWEMWLLFRVGFLSYGARWHTFYCH